MLQLHLSDQQFNYLLKCVLYKRLDGRYIHSYGITDCIIYMILVIYQWFVYNIRVKVSFNVSFIKVSASFCNPDLTYLNTIWQHRVPKIRGQKDSPCCALGDGTCQARPFLSLQSYDVLISMWWLIRSLLAPSCILKIALFQVEVKSLYNTVNLLQNA